MHVTRWAGCPIITDAFRRCPTWIGIQVHPLPSDGTESAHVRPSCGSPPATGEHIRTEDEECHTAVPGGFWGLLSQLEGVDIDRGAQEEGECGHAPHLPMRTLGQLGMFGRKQWSQSLRALPGGCAHARASGHCLGGGIHTRTGGNRCPEAHNGTWFRRWCPGGDTPPWESDANVEVEVERRHRGALNDACGACSGVATPDSPSLMPMSSDATEEPPTTPMEPAPEQRPLTTPESLMLISRSKSSDATEEPHPTTAVEPAPEQRPLMTPVSQMPRASTSTSPMVVAHGSEPRRCLLMEEAATEEPPKKKLRVEGTLASTGLNRTAEREHWGPYGPTPNYRGLSRALCHSRPWMVWQAGHRGS